MTIKTAQHTLTPWRCMSATTIVGPDGKPIATAKIVWPTPNFEEQKANIAFIVRACNAHERLLEVLRQFVNALIVNDLSELDAACQEAEAAIAKAEGA